MTEQGWQIIIQSAVTLLVAVVGIVSTCIAAQSSSKSEIQKVIILRFVEMFETAAQGLSAVSDVYANLQILFSTPMSKEALAVRLQSMIKLGQDCCEVAKTADSAVLRLNIYFSDPKREGYDYYPSTSAILNLVEWIVKLDRQMSQEGRTTVTEEEYTQYQSLEQITADSIKPLQVYYKERREYFNRCYATWRKKNLSFLKWN